MVRGTAIPNQSNVYRNTSMYIYHCEQCDFTTTNAKAVAPHLRKHDLIKPYVCCIQTKKQMRTSLFAKYVENCGNCGFCGEIISPGKKYCNNSCAGKTQSRETKAKSYEKLSNSFKDASCNRCNTLFKVKSQADVSRVVCLDCKATMEELAKQDRINNKRYTCGHCGIKFKSSVYRKYCKADVEKYTYSARGGFKFTFNMDSYPDLFDMMHIREVGFYKPHANLRGSGKVNKNGYVRDHRVSVNDAIRNGYDPKYITHPLNCEVMHNSDNAKKRANSSMSYAELVSAVDAYEAKKK